MGERTRVLHVITRLVVGGAQENTLLTVDRLDPDQFEVYLASGPTEGPEGSLEDRIPTHVPFIRVRQLRRDPAPINDLIALWQLYRFIRQHRFQIVHTHTTKAGIVGRLAAMLAGTPVIIHSPHGHAFTGYLNRAGAAALVGLERWLAAHTHKVICLTETERDEHVAYGVAPAEKFVVIHSGVEISRFRPSELPADRSPWRRAALGLPDEGPIVGCVARLVPVKGVQILLEAVPQIVSMVPDATVVFVGDGSLRAQMVERSKALGLNRRVLFLGLRRDVAQLMNHFTVAVQPSLNEGMGKAAVEAMAAGIPVVASSVSGLLNVVSHERTGLLVPPGDSDQLARAVADLLRDPQRRREMGREGRIKAENFTVETMVAKIARLYGMALNVAPSRDESAVHTTA